jgi:hypothetical protein
VTSDHYILDDNGEPIRVSDLDTWAKSFGKNPLRRVALEQVGNYTISTVFLGLDFNLNKTGPAILWETMVFPADSYLETERDRCSGGREQAEAMHAAMVDRVKAIT